MEVDTDEKLRLANVYAKMMGGEILDILKKYHDHLNPNMILSAVQSLVARLAFMSAPNPKRAMELMSDAIKRELSLAPEFKAQAEEKEESNARE
jgi:hypothetical protein